MADSSKDSFHVQTAELKFVVEILISCSASTLSLKKMHTATLVDGCYFNPSFVLVCKVYMFILVKNIATGHFCIQRLLIGSLKYMLWHVVRLLE